MTQKRQPMQLWNKNKYLLDLGIGGSALGIRRKIPRERRPGQKGTLLWSSFPAEKAASFHGTEVVIRWVAHRVICTILEMD